MIDINEVEKIHEILIEKFGGAKGIRDKEFLNQLLIDPIRHLTVRNFIQVQ